MSGSCKIMFALFVFTALLLSEMSAGGDAAAEWMMPAVRSGCRGTFAKYLEDEQDFDLDSETNRRILSTRQYIIYGSLQRNNVPCSRRGSSYYNCRNSQQVNPYNHGCVATH